MKTDTNMNTKKEDTPTMADIPTITPEMVEEIKIEISKKSENAVVKCGSCGLVMEMPKKENFEEIDVYCSFIDNYYS